MEAIDKTAWMPSPSVWILPQSPRRRQAHPHTRTCTRTRVAMCSATWGCEHGNVQKWAPDDGASVVLKLQ
eukprot:15437653-Alexandrium_andersonii.AAC.1